jgi:hypothetical protein
MGYDLTNASGDSHQWKSVGWWYLLNLARHFGWKPAGTLPPAAHDEPSAWDGNYFHNDGQRVTAPDAAALADSLEKMLRSPTRVQAAQAVGARMDEILDDQAITPQTPLADVDTYPLDFVRQMFARFKQTSVGHWEFDSKSDEYLSEFIAFCRKGAFEID